MKTIRYHPIRILHNKTHPICTMTYGTKQEAVNYALSRGLNNKEIHIQELIYYDDSWNTHIDFNKVENEL
jgi:hypothetical protein